MSYISEIFARQILDSRGNPTIEVDDFHQNIDSLQTENICPDNRSKA